MTRVLQACFWCGWSFLDSFQKETFRTLVRELLANFHQSRALCGVVGSWQVRPLEEMEALGAHCNFPQLRHCSSSWPPCPTSNISIFSFQAVHCGDTHSDAPRHFAMSRSRCFASNNCTTRVHFATPHHAKCTLFSANMWLLTQGRLVSRPHLLPLTPSILMLSEWVSTLQRGQVLLWSSHRTKQCKQKACMQGFTVALSSILTSSERPDQNSNLSSFNQVHALRERTQTAVSIGRKQIQDLFLRHNWAYQKVQCSACVVFAQLKTVLACKWNGLSVGRSLHIGHSAPDKVSFSAVQTTVCARSRLDPVPISTLVMIPTVSSKDLSFTLAIVRALGEADLIGSLRNHIADK